MEQLVSLFLPGRKCQQPAVGPHSLDRLCFIVTIVTRVSPLPQFRGQQMFPKETSQRSRALASSQGLACRHSGHSCD